jgi:hypothetical protein
MSKIIELVKAGAKIQREILNELAADCLKDVELHHEELDMVLALDFNAIEDPDYKGLAIYLALDTIRDAKETLASMKKLVRAGELLERIG